MTTLVHQCPHCLADRMTLTAVHISDGPMINGAASYYVFLRCNGCGGPSAAQMQNFRSPTPIGNVKSELQNAGYGLRRFWPAVPKPRVPPHCPERVAKAYLAAETVAGRSGMEEMAAASYGRALDVGTKLFAEAHAPDLVGRTLFTRITKLAEMHLITKALADWAHAIRLIRNDALHEPDGVTADDLTAIRGFTETVLTYLFSLPGMLAERQAATDQKPTPDAGVQPT